MKWGRTKTKEKKSEPSPGNIVLSYESPARKETNEVTTEMGRKKIGKTTSEKDKTK